MVQLTLNRRSVLLTSKNISLFTAAFFFSIGAVLGQEQQVSDSTFVATSWRAPYKYLNIEDYEMKLMFKVVQPSYNKYYGISGGNLSIEAKLSPSFSFEGGYVIPSHEFHSVFGRFRYYVNKSKKSGGINNLVGSHFLVGAKKAFEPKREYIAYQGIYPNDLELTAGYGYQGKVGRFGYYNALAVVNYGLDRKLAYGALRIDAGFGYGAARRPKESEKAFGPISAYQRKLGLLKLSNIGFSWGAHQKEAGIEVAYERLLWKDLAVEGILRGSFGRLEYSLRERISRTYEYSTLSADVNLKYYYNKKKRLARGKLSAPFSGPYVLIGITDSDDNNLLIYPDGFGSKRGVFDQITYRAAWGYQQPIGKYGFIDINIGPSFNADQGFDIITHLKIGLRF